MKLGRNKGSITYSRDGILDFRYLAHLVGLIVKQGGRLDMEDGEDE